MHARLIVVRCPTPQLIDQQKVKVMVGFYLHTPNLIYDRTPSTATSLSPVV